MNRNGSSSRSAALGGLGLPIHAANGVAEYWTVKLAERGVEIFRRPSPKRRRHAVAQRVGARTKIEVVRSALDLT